eukprot:TRINITY_DN1412_c0_g1_i9.p1 TRINITY_DN1412_c0_g1~~TRINITY_DN1412_c0_g1_i9.p1  ORF type:complete len:290 (+),score=34.31 TRINITY_DN1412_c0_g1_i9:90-959(+)
MSQTGTAKRWNDEKGFGFISPNDGGADVFCHCTALGSDRAPLEQGSTVYFDIEQDSRSGKDRAANVSGPGVQSGGWGGGGGGSWGSGGGSCGGGRGRRGGGGGGYESRPGDWTCPRCRANVFASKRSCFKCGASKPGGANRCRRAAAAAQQPTSAAQHGAPGACPPHRGGGSGEGCSPTMKKWSCGRCWAPYLGEKPPPQCTQCGWLSGNDPHCARSDWRYVSADWAKDLLVNNEKRERELVADAEDSQWCALVGRQASAPGATSGVGGALGGRGRGRGRGQIVDTTET